MKITDYGKGVTKEVWDNGTIIHRKNGKPHRDGFAAVILPKGDKIWMQDGKIGRKETGDFYTVWITEEDKRYWRDVPEDMQRMLQRLLVVGEM